MGAMTWKIFAATSTERRRPKCECFVNDFIFDVTILRFQVKSYYDVFWRRVDELENKDRILAQIDRGVLKIQTKRALDAKVRRTVGCSFHAA